MAVKKLTDTNEREDLFKGLLTKRESKKSKNFNGEEEPFIFHDAAKDHFKKNYKDYDKLKEVSKSLKEWNEDAVSFAIDKIEKEFKEGEERVTVRIPNGTGPYDNITIKGRKSKDKDGKDSVSISYKVKSGSMYPSSSRFKEEKERLKAAVLNS